ncbi:acetoacetate metabolism regulatory protein AtoC [Desulfoluna limicola]|uniref:Acetoacetate metabolism regulatory protein AtoC n=1 Tax=Desulfoluna limicola TaxID=2810562 RepID=A0ABN6F121_9BACT|nr:sigma-54 dependent transcriptional regulator [Desulfoluna limicola]BCS95230.1 acetoacetate metabolism regulatory protein AtoC [Desulfoluna limicola]
MMPLDYQVYVVDDEETIREGIALALSDCYTLTTFADAESAIEKVAEAPPDLILMDIGLPGMTGMEALGRIKEIHPEVLVIMITAYEDINSVITCMKRGAYDYIIKPIHMEELENTIKNALETIRLRKEVRALQERQLTETTPCFIGESNAIHDVMAFISMVAKSPDTPVLILGETGTGKELIASTIHYRSPNFQGPFVTVNCAAIHKELIESELFGYEKGAFSGASTSGKTGLIEAAEGGTLFLDEVGDMGLDTQAKLLRFLEEGEFYKVGSTQKRKVQTRIVSATNRDLDKMILEETFRKDLYFRLGVIKINVPSLNERRDDTLILANYFMHTFAEKFNKPILGMTDEAEKRLLIYSWSGNVRELRNMMERGVLTARGERLTVEDLGLEDVRRGEVMENGATGFAPLPPTGIDIQEVRVAMETFYFKEALRIAKGNESKAARLLNLNHHTFRYQRKKILPDA